MILQRSNGSYDLVKRCIFINADIRLLEALDYLGLNALLFSGRQYRLLRPDERHGVPVLTQTSVRI